MLFFTRFLAGVEKKTYFCTKMCTMMKKLSLFFFLMLSVCGAMAYDISATVDMPEEDTWLLTLELSGNDADFCAFQLDVTLDGSGVMDGEQVTAGSVCGSHRLALGSPEGQGHYRIVGYNMQNAPFDKQEGTVVTFKVTGALNGIAINRILFSKSDGTEVEASDYAKSIDRKDYEDGMSRVATDRKERVVTYNMAGQQVYAIDRRGIYIQKGKKVLK